MDVVRPAADGDLDAVLQVLHDGPRSPSDVERATSARIRATPDVTVHLAEADGEPVGTVCLLLLPNLTYECRPTAFVEAMRVAPDHRRRGVATRLLERLLDDARAAGCDKVQLLSHERHAHDGAHALYEGLGFRAEAEGFRRYLQSSFREPGPHEGEEPGRVLEVGGVAGPGNEGETGVAADRVHEATAVGGELHVRLAGDDEHRGVDAPEAIPQRVLRPGAGDAE